MRGERGGRIRRAVSRRAVLSAQDVRSVQSTVLCRSVLCVFVRGALRYVPCGSVKLTPGLPGLRLFGPRRPGSAWG